VAVVQISKIQIRRGLKSTGVPQLSSAELAWAVDTQELYIGNGSVAEGAPYVGNTKVLTEHDNILELASSYQYASDDPSITEAVNRSLQSKTDEYVSVADFGAVGDGSTDCVTAFETAFTQLFRNADTNYRKVLRVPNGEYLFLSDLEIPSNVILEGETQDGAILNFGDHNIRLITSTGDDLTLFSSTNRPQHIKISNLTISRTTGQTVLTGATNTELNKVKFLGEYQLGDTVSNIVTEPAAVFWENSLSGTRVTDISFINCVFEANSIGVKCSQSITDDTYIEFDGCEFFVCDTGTYINGTSAQGNYWSYSHCKFEEIAKQAFRSTAGSGTVISNTSFINCGNDTNTADSPVSAIVYFGEYSNNIVKDCTSNRMQSANIVSSATVPAVTEVFNGDMVNFTDRVFTEVYLTDSFRPSVILSAQNRFFEVDYTLRLSSHFRKGKLTFSIDEDYTDVIISDEYQYSADSATSPGGVLMTNFEFDAELRDNDSDSGIETVVLYYKNPLATGASGTLSFNVTYGV
jgi:hypothetical protein